MIEGRLMGSRSSDRSEASATPALVRTCYVRLRASTGHGSRLAVLQIGAAQTVIVAGTAAEPQDTMTMAVGFRRTAREHFKHGLPTAVELEAAIATVEDAISPVLPLIGNDTALYTTNAIVREIALASGLREAPDLQLSLDAVERTFSRLAAVAHGSPASVQGIPRRADFAATLLILRELMHHAQRPSITVSA